MKEQVIGFIGGGNMARSLIGGLIKNGWESGRIRVSDPAADQRQAIAGLFGVAATEDNTRLIDESDIVILAVKPQHLHPVCSEIAATVQAKKPLVISIAAGILERDIQRWLGDGVRIVRVMPNTPALVASGASGLFANDLTNESDRTTAESIMRAVGVTVWLDDESLLHTVTALSGSGPAYFLLFMESLEQAAIELGLEARTARLLTLETALGTARLALESDDELGVLRQHVTSPGGTTERALRVLESGELRNLLRQAVQAAADRSRELATMLGDDE